MSYGLDFVKMLSGALLLSAGLLYLFWRTDEELQQCSYYKLIRNWLCYGSMISLGIFQSFHQEEMGGRVSLIFLGVYLTVCAVADVLMSQVYDVMQYLGVLAGCIWILEQEPRKGVGFSLILFVGMQYLILMKKYGKADGMGFCVCALFLAGRGADIEGYLYHMVISFLLLAMVQLLRKNVSKKGNLKTPVALYPYISAGFLIMWIFLFKFIAL